MTEPQFKITLAQLNPTVGDVAGNAAKARAARAQARADGGDLLVLPELFITGYPPEDLVLKPAFQAACRAAVEELARETADGGPAVLIGTISWSSLFVEPVEPLAASTPTTVRVFPLITTV